MTILGTAWVANDWDSILFRRERSTLFATFYDYSREFLEVDPEVNFQIVHNWGRLDAGDYDLWVDIFWDDEFEEGEGYFNVYHNLFSTRVFRPINGFRLDLDQGWNLVSINIDPLDANIPVMFIYLIQHENLLIVKDNQGRFFLPSRNFNNIPRWDFRQAYQIKMTARDELEVEGFRVPPDEPIPLRQGWNLCAYFPEEEIEAPEAFRNIRDILIIAKDQSGHYYNPGRDFNNMPPLRRGQGYQIKVRERAELIWFVP